MKGMQGLIIALVMAIAGGVCNWMYLANQADRYERMAFIKVDVDEIRIGDKFKEEHFAKVEIPRNALGNIETTAVKWSDLNTVVGKVAIRDYARDQILLHEDLRTPPTMPLNKLIGKDELYFWLPIDPRSLNPQQVNPGDLISFRVPRQGVPTPATGNLDGDATKPKAELGVSAIDEIIGPFRILALGNRRGSLEVAKAGGQTGGSESSIALVAEFRDGKFERKAARIIDINATTGMKGVQPLLHPANVK